MKKPGNSTGPCDVVQAVPLPMWSPRIDQTKRCQHKQFLNMATPDCDIKICFPLSLPLVFSTLQRTEGAAQNLEMRKSIFKIRQHCFHCFHWFYMSEDEHRKRTWNSFYFYYIMWWKHKDSQINELFTISNLTAPQNAVFYILSSSTLPVIVKWIELS